MEVETGTNCFPVSKNKLPCNAGLQAIVVAPSRELAMQIYGVASDLMKYHSQTHGKTFYSNKQSSLKIHVNVKSFLIYFWNLERYSM